MSALALFLVVVPPMGGIATHTSWSGSRFDKNVLENVCDNTFVQDTTAEQLFQQHCAVDQVHGLHQIRYTLRADKKIYEGDPFDLRIDYINEFDSKLRPLYRGEACSSLYHSRQAEPQTSELDSAWDPGPPEGSRASLLSGFCLCTHPCMGSHVAMHVHTIVHSHHHFQHAQFAPPANVVHCESLRDAHPWTHTSCKWTHGDINSLSSPWNTQFPWQVPLAGGSLGRAGWTPNPGMGDCRCEEGTLVGSLASSYAGMAPGVQGPRCCVLSLHTTHHTYNLTYSMYASLTLLTYTYGTYSTVYEYTSSKQVQVWRGRAGEQLETEAGRPPEHASSKGGHRLASIASLAPFRFAHQYFPHCVPDMPSLANMVMCLSMYRVPRNSAQLIFGCLTLTFGWVTNVEAGPRVATRSSGSGSGSGSIPKAKDFTPNMQDKWDFLPGMKRWDGIPHYDFVKIWIAALIVALGSIVQGGNTLLQCANGTDGGRSGDDSPEDQRDHANRRARLFACIMNYIDPTSKIHRTASEHFPNEGPKLFKWLKIVGQLAIPEETKEQYRRNFDQATMANVGIPFTPEGIFKWLNWVDDNGERGGIGKSLNQKRKKFLEGFPSSFDVVITPERMKPDPGSYVLPANFPDHHPKAGEADPNGGKPDLDALARALYPEWNRRISSGHIKAVPKGSVYMANDEACDECSSSAYGDDSDGESNQGMDAMAVSRGKVNAMMVCIVCGGLGHASNVDGMQCLTAQLGIKVPKHDLAKIKYPNGIKFPEWSRRPNGKDRGGTSSDAMYSEKDKKKHNPHRKHPTKDKKKLYKKKEVRQAEPEPSESSSESEEDQAPESKFASVYHTIDIRPTRRNPHYQSYSSDSEDTSESATTEASSP